MNECLECGATVDAGDDPMVGEILACAACGVELEITQVGPIVLGLAPEIEEDWGE